MGIRKYIKDYRKEYIVKPNGKPGVTATYIGKYYRFVNGEDAIKKARLVFACLSVFATICCIVPFCYSSSGSHTIYVAVPHVISLFPLVHLVMGVYNLYTRKPPFIREFRDKTEQRVYNMSIGSACCLGITAMAQLVNCILNGFSLADTLYIVFVAVACVAVGYIFSARKVLKTEECDEENNG